MVFVGILLTFKFRKLYNGLISHLDTVSCNGNRFASQILCLPSMIDLSSVCSVEMNKILYLNLVCKYKSFLMCFGGITVHSNVYFCFSGMFVLALTPSSSSFVNVASFGREHYCDAHFKSLD